MQSPKVLNAHTVALVYVSVSSLGMLRQFIRWVLRSPPIPKTPFPDSMNTFFDRLQFASFPLTLGLELMLSFPKYFNLFDVQSRRFQQRLTPDGTYILEFACLRIIVGIVTSLIVTYAQQYDVRPGTKLVESMLHFLLSFSYVKIMLAGDMPSFEIPFGLHCMVGFAGLINYVRVMNALYDDSQKDQQPSRPKQD